MSSQAPEPQRTTATWTGAELRDDPQEWAREWTTPLLDDLIELVDETLDATGEADLVQFDPSTFAPTSIRDFAADIRRDLIDGRGFTIVRGFPVDRLDRRTVAIAFFIFGGLVGRPRSQNAAGHLLGHVRDVGADLADPGTRIYQTKRTSVVPHRFLRCRRPVVPEHG